MVRRESGAGRDFVAGIRARSDEPALISWQRERIRRLAAKQGNSLFFHKNVVAALDVPGYWRITGDPRTWLSAHGFGAFLEVWPSARRRSMRGFPSSGPAGHSSDRARFRCDPRRSVRSFGRSSSNRARFHGLSSSQRAQFWDRRVAKRAWSDETKRAVGRAYSSMIR